MTAEQKKAAEAVVMKKMQKGPVVFAAIRREGFGSFARGLVTQYLILTTAAVLLTWLVMQTSELSYAKRVIFLGVVGLCASVIADLPTWDWGGLLTRYTAGVT